MSSPKERFAVLNEFRGYGNPNGPLWFVGLEGAGEWKPAHSLDADKYKKYALGYYPFKRGEIKEDSANDGRRYTKVYDIMSKFAVVVLEGSDSSLWGWSDYRDNKLLLEGKDTFQANLYPVGKPGMDQWPAQYEELFNLPTPKDYYTELRDTRFPKLRDFHKTHRPRVTVCFGRASAKGDFERLFELEKKDFEESDKCRFYANGIVLCPFFDPRHMSDDRIASSALRCVKKYLGLSATGRTAAP